MKITKVQIGDQKVIPNEPCEGGCRGVVPLTGGDPKVVPLTGGRELDNNIYWGVDHLPNGDFKIRYPSKDETHS